MAKTKTQSLHDQVKTRKAHNRALEADKLRSKMKGVEYLRQITGDMTRLTALQKSVKDAKNTKKNDFVVSDTVLRCKAQADIIKIKLDTNFKRLNKVIPDLKAFEHTDPDGNNPFADFMEVMADATR